MNSNYRPDIDGLRAVSVLLVLFFHAGVFGIQAGFVGVDVFFVISGFLITTGIKNGLEKGNFSFCDFFPKSFGFKQSFRFFIYCKIFFTLFSKVFLGTITIRPQPLHFNLKSAPVLIISHSLVPQGCPFFNVTTARLINSTFSLSRFPITVCDV